MDARLDGLAYSLAGPVTKSLLTGKQAYVTLGLAAAKLPDGEAEFAAAGASLRSAVALARDNQRNVMFDIIIAIGPLIGARRPLNVLLAEAHGINGAQGWWFTEAQVTQIVMREIREHINKTSKGGKRHGGQIR